MTNSTTTAKTYDVFISHNSDCKPWVTVLAKNLSNQGLAVFLDGWEMIPEHSIVQSLYDGITRSRKGILVVTPEAIESGWVKTEYYQMMAQAQVLDDFRIIPVILGENLPDVPFLQDMLWVDFRDPTPYAQAFYRLHCAINDQTPGPNAPAQTLTLPPSKASEYLPSPSEAKFIADLFELFYKQQAVLLFAQADRGQSKAKAYLLQQAKDLFGQHNVMHIAPPFSPQAAMPEYCSAVAQQCGFSGHIEDTTSLTRAFDERLNTGKRLFILVSAFESSSEAGQKALSGVFRSLNERYPDHFRLLMCGGEQLATLYFTGTLSYLNFAETLEWPELTSADIKYALDRLPPDQKTGQADDLLAISGGHPKILAHCLEIAATQAVTADTCQQVLEGSAFIWQHLMPFLQDDSKRKHLSQLLEKDEVAPAPPYIFDDFLRRLYWQNFLKRGQEHHNRLFWRCDLIRTVSLNAIAQYESSVSASSMRLFIRQIELSNIRCFKHLFIQLQDPQADARWMMILGDNAAGKTTLLRSIALGLCNPGDAITLMAQVPGSFIRHGEDTASIKLTLQPKGSDKTYVIQTSLLKNANDQEIVQQTTTPENDFPWQGIFVCGYGTQRILQASTSYHQYQSLQAVKTLFDYDTALQNPELVLLRQAPALKTRLEEKLLAILMLDAADNKIVQTENGMGIHSTWGESLFASLSDGYRSTTQWILDFLSWAIYAKRFTNEQEVDGILIIDELEQHLHPKWQRYVLDRLRKQFPNVQLICTTHTPLIAAGMADIDSGLLLRLTPENQAVRGEPIDLTQLKGKRADQVLTEAFGLITTRTPHSADALARYTELSGKSRSSKEEEELTQLAQHLENSLVFGENPFEQQVEKAVSQALEALLDTAASQTIQLETKRQLRALFRHES